MHWYSYQISILVHICFHHNLEYDPYDEETRILTKYHFYVFDDRKHDSEFVQHCFKLHWQHMVEQRYALKWHFVWLDGYVPWFKSTKPWYFMSRYPSVTSGCKMMWSFFGNGHGKGPHDGVGAIIKRFIRHKQLNVHGEKLTNA
jgi:hypothetical protein